MSSAKSKKAGRAEKRKWIAFTLLNRERFDV